MFQRGKYVVGTLKTTSIPMSGAICFPDYCDHRQTAQACMDLDTITGAGFFTISSGTELGTVSIHVFGKSVSLGIESNPERDRRAIARCLGIDNYE